MSNKTIQLNSLVKEQSDELMCKFRFELLSTIGVISDGRDRFHLKIIQRCLLAVFHVIQVIQADFQVIKVVSHVIQVAGIVRAEQIVRNPRLLQRHTLLLLRGPTLAFWSTPPSKGPCDQFLIVKVKEDWRRNKHLLVGKSCWEEAAARQCLTSGSPPGPTRF